MVFDSIPEGLVLQGFSGRNVWIFDGRLRVCSRSQGVQTRVGEKPYAAHHDAYAWERSHTLRILMRLTLVVPLSMSGRTINRTDLA